MAMEVPVPFGSERTQLVTVVTASWDDFRARLQRFERVPGGSSGAGWQAVGEGFDVVLGREGYGWGRGLHGSGRPANRPGPMKREGDGRSPAGVFALGTAYGYAAERRDLLLPYVHATSELRCVDDSHSSHYNRIVSTADTEVDWRSAEHMRRKDDLYVIAIVVEHNTKNTKAGAGSCIFIHLWDGPDKGMTGCTAMPREALDELARWLRPGEAALVALPNKEYEVLERPWRLPPLEPAPEP